MSFTLVIVPRPEMHSPDHQKWGTFHAYAKVESLQKTEGVFYIDETAWIFDMRKALPAYGLVVHQANEAGIQLFYFPLGAEETQFRVLSYPRSERLEAFLKA